MRIGFIGAGGHARNTHLSLMKRIKGVKVAGIADLSMETAGAAVRDFGGEAFGDAGKMLDTVKPDAVFVCVSPSAHGEIENMLIDRSIPFLVEKPIALDLGKAHEIEKKIKQKKLIVASGYQWRYLDLLERARELIGNFPVLLVQGYWLSKRPAVSWWHNPSLSGGQIVEQATHMIDLTRYLLGEPLELHAVMSPPAEGSAVPAASVLTIRYPGSVPASIICACALPVRYRCGFV
ncbi:MAG: Gfo/Idh/MocA family oxidoreductase, partial [Lentisphaerae bacterium]|nr:Gfo/Idh/MocA family oxidoreductase [Lentisphaerota bacterium]